uniref:Uncharacterized protein n=1 Tax=Anopheles coluzzii TaxID=1518534 RepID=A0A8W7P8L8_ANOCL
MYVRHYRPVADVLNTTIDGGNEIRRNVVQTLNLHLGRELTEQQQLPLYVSLGVRALGHLLDALQLTFPQRNTLQPEQLNVGREQPYPAHGRHGQRSLLVHHCLTSVSGNVLKMPSSSSRLKTVSFSTTSTSLAASRISVTLPTSSGTAVPHRPLQSIRCPSLSVSTIGPAINPFEVLYTCSSHGSASSSAQTSSSVAYV